MVGAASIVICTFVSAPASATVDVASARYQGADRFETAALMAFSGTVTTSAVVARGDQFADALAGAYVAGATSSTLLLTRTEAMPAATVDAINFMGITDVTLLGGTAAISPAVETQLRGLGVSVSRISGADRYETARAAASVPATIGSLNGRRTALLASGVNFPDALAAGPLAAGARLPLLLTAPAGLTGAAREAIGALGIQHVVVLGGPAALSPAVESQVAAISGVTVERIGGADRGATSVALAQLARNSLGFSTTRLGFARGDSFADALAYAPLAGSERGGRNALELTSSPTAVGDAVLADVRALSTSLVRIEIAGGESAISAAVAEQLLNTARGTAGPVVSFPTTTAAPGGTLTGTVNGADIGVVTVSGCGLAGQPVRTGPGSFTVTVASGQAVGTCTLAFTITSTTGQPSVTRDQVLTVAASAPIRPQLVTSAPDLLTTEVVAATIGDSQPNTVRFTFDAPVAAGAVAQLSLVGYDSLTKLTPASVAVDSANSSAVIASFADTDVIASATVGVAGAGAVTAAAGGTVNTIGSAPLKGTAFTPGDTSLPQLSAATPDAAGNRVTYTFDQAVEDAEPSSFGYYDAAGTFTIGSSIVSQSANAVVVQFTAGVAQGVRYAVDFAAVANAEGSPNPEGAVGPLTSAPDLLTVQRVQGSTTVFDFAFDDVVSTAVPGFDPARFTVYTDDGRFAVGEAASQPSDRVIRITFPSDANHDRRAVMATVEARATGRIADGVGSTIGAAVFATAGFGSNLTDGPDLLAATFDSGGDKITYTFDDLIDVANVPPDASKLFAVKADGSLVAGSAIGAVTGPSVTVSFPSGSVAGAAGAAATSSVLTGPGAGSALGDAAYDRATPPGLGNPNSPGAVGGGPGAQA